MYFDQPGDLNTDLTIRLAHRRARELGVQEVVIASTSGDTAYRALEVLKDFKVVVVTYHCGYEKPFENMMADDVREDLEKEGLIVVSAGHALSGVERAVAQKHGGVYPGLLVADTLRLMGQGLKVAVEISLMAADAGVLSGMDIVAIGGSGKGVDTAVVIKPTHQSRFFDLKIREIICKPRDF